MPEITEKPKKREPSKAIEVLRKAKNHYRRYYCRETPNSEDDEEPEAQLTTLYLVFRACWGRMHSRVLRVHAFSSLSDTKFFVQRGFLPSYKVRKLNKLHHPHRRLIAIYLLTC